MIFEFKHSMKKKNKILITIDGIRKDRVGCYNKNKEYLTPNLTKIANESIVMNDMMACGTSTAMCFSSLFTGQYQKKFNRKRYGDNENPFSKNIFTDLEQQGYKTFICLNRRFNHCFNLINTLGRNTKIWWTGYKSRSKNLGSLRPKEQINYIIDELKTVNSPFFIWVHLWGFSQPQNKFRKISSSDYEARTAELDDAIGIAFEKFKKNSELFFLSDHGYAFFENDKWAYGKDGNNLAESVTTIPAIIYNGKEKGYNNNLVSQIQFRKIIYESKKALEIKDKFAYCESRYLNEFDISLAIRYQKFKFIIEFNKKRKYLYDVNFDPNENMNLLSNNYYKTKRDAKGNHIALKPYIIRDDWSDIKKIFNKLDRLANDFYDFSKISVYTKIKNIIKSKMRSLKKIYT